MERFWQDLRLSARSLVKAPGFALISVLTIALGIGSSTAMFSAFHAALLKPLPYTNPEQLYFLWEDASMYGSPKDSPAAANYFDWREQSRSFADMTAISTRHHEPDRDWRARAVGSRDGHREFLLCSGRKTGTGSRIC